MSQGSRTVQPEYAVQARSPPWDSGLRNAGASLEALFPARWLGGPNEFAAIRQGRS